MTNFIILFVMLVTLKPSIASFPGLKSLGEFRESAYYISDNALQWFPAQDACQEHLGPLAKLVCLETQAELNYVWDLVDRSDDIYSSLWLGARANLATGKFLWCDETEFEDWIPWGPSEPKHATDVTSVATRAAGGFEFFAEMRTVSKQFICELDLSGTLPTSTGTPTTTLATTTTTPTTTTASPICTRDIDLSIILDSASVLPANFLLAKQFAAALADKYTPHNGNRLGFITFGHVYKLVISIHDNPSPDTARTKILATTAVGVSRATYHGLELSLAQYLTFPRSVLKVAVLITNGPSTSFSLTQHYAKDLNVVAGARTFAVGVTGNVDQDELLAISYNHPERVFNVGGFDELMNILDELHQAICT